MIHVNMAVVLVLGLLVVFTSSATTAVQVSAFVASAIVLFTAAALIVRFTPYSEKDAWKAPVKVMVLAVTLLSATVNLVYFESRQVPTLAKFADFCAYVLLAACVLLILVFFVSFWRALLPFRLGSWRHWFLVCRQRVFNANLRGRLARKRLSVGTVTRGGASVLYGADSELEVDAVPRFDRASDSDEVDDENSLFIVDSDLSVYESFLPPPPLGTEAGARFDNTSNWRTGVFTERESRNVVASARRIRYFQVQSSIRITSDSDVHSPNSI